MKIAMHNEDGLGFVFIDHIIYVQSDSNYSKVFLTNQNPLLVLKSIKIIENMIPEENFIRIHHEFLFNFSHLVRYEKKEGGYIVLSDASKLPVSRTRNKAFFDKVFNKFK